MSRRIATGIDIGTHQTKVVVVEEVVTPAGPELHIIGTGISESRGMRHGYVVDAEDAAESVRLARQQAEQTARVPIRKGFLAVGGVSLDEVRASGQCIISRADQEITDLDLEKVLDTAREAAKPNFLNRSVLHEIPLEYRVDGTKMLGEPVGIKGTRLEADYLFITCLTQHTELLTATAEAAEIEIIDRMASPLAGSYVTLTKDQKMKGCVLANIGAETVSIVVYDEGLPISVKVFPIGSTNITDDLALGFKVSLEDAERLKMGRLGGAMYPRKKVEEIVTARFRTMFELIDKHLKTIGRRGSLPAGIVISGGASGQGSISDIAKGTLNLPSRIADLKVSADTKVRDATWAVAYGLALWGLTGDTDTPKKHGAGEFLATIQKFLKQFLP
ncbi:cell division protein FtsA [Patescibacteria group bacterium]|nr:cell division protein FtsA [Patescibacteria group bacterium]MBU2158794.1 cell division protein FtsA [Patescibacteria group bacterium]MBU2220441.1 cell division protein FtsA [Patescibacteria group bacterium]